MITGNLLWVLIGTMLLGIASGMIGSYSYLQKQSLVGDAASHAALPGIAIAFMMSGQKTLPVLMFGAAITSALAVYCIQFIIRYSKLKADSAIGLVLSVFFGLGIVLLTTINKNGNGNQSGLNDFIFGKAAIMTSQDLVWLLVTACLILLISLLFYKEWKLMIFDPQYAKNIGLPVEWLRMVLTGLVVLTIVTGIQAVGVILMSAMLIIPAVTARLWTLRLSTMLTLSAVIGGFAGAGGTFISSLRSGLSTGPIIVLLAAVIFFISYMISPEKGLWSRYKRKKNFQEDVIHEVQK